MSEAPTRGGASAGAREKLGLGALVAMGVGGMVGGGIFSVLGLAAGLAGHAAPVAFAFGGAVALLTGWSYTKLGLAFHSDGGSFTYLEAAFRHRNVAGVGGWLLLAGYVGTMALYAYTFGVYGAAILGNSQQPEATQHFLGSLVLLVFLGVNLYGVRAAGESEVVIVMIKVAILALFGIIGLGNLDGAHLVPLFDQGGGGLVMGAALIFVAYEGFELIPNAVNEMANPHRDLGWAVFLSIGLTTLIYVLVATVSIANLSPTDIHRYKEYALAVAARPFLGQGGFLLIGVAAALSTASAINATMFGTARLARVMAQEDTLPPAFAHRERAKDIPYVSLLAITGLALLLVNTGTLTVISSFCSSTFLLVFAAVNLSALRVRQQIAVGIATPLVGLALTAGSWLALWWYLWHTNAQAVLWIAFSYVAVAVGELLCSRRCVWWPHGKRGA